jgi:uncharacterized lipoprotein
MSGRRLTALVLTMTLVSGCKYIPWHPFEHLAGNINCHKAQDYQRAAQVPPIKVPAGLDSPNTQSALVIPTVDATAPPPPGPNEPCLDVPPKYKPAPPPKGLSG